METEQLLSTDFNNSVNYDEFLNIMSLYVENHIPQPIILIQEEHMGSLLQLRAGVVGSL